MDEAKKGNIPVVKFKNSDRILSLPIIRFFTGEKRIVGQIRLSPVDAKIGIAQIKKVKEQVLGFIQDKTAGLEVIEDEAHDIADEAGIPFDKEKRKQLNDEE